MIRLGFHGAARTVTGSQYVLAAGGERLMVDCGLFQGAKELRLRNWEPPEHDPATLAGVVLTHTHLDHIGRLPRLVRQGFRGRVYCTPATEDLAAVLLRDAAELQEEDARYLNRKGLTKHQPALPLFDGRDVDRTLPLLSPVPLGERVEVSKSFAFAFQDAGHILGAASALVEARDTGGAASILFSGDLGRYDTVLTRDPAPAAEADYVVMESTYGNRRHDTVPVLDQLEAVIRRTFARGGVVLVPAFAVGRAQQLLNMLDTLFTSGRLRPFPVHLDSPMAVEATRIYDRYPEAHRPSVGAIAGRSAFHAKWLNLSRTGAESKKLNELRGPAMIISSSGMLSGGRVLHHCRVRLPHAENTLVITGHQAAGTLGRRLLEGAQTARIHKGEVPVLAEVTELRGLSAHGDAGELLRWLSGVQRAPKRVFVTHGEEEAAMALAARVTVERGFATHVPAWDEVVDLGAA